MRLKADFLLDQEGVGLCCCGGKVGKEVMIIRPTACSMIGQTQIFEEEKGPCKTKKRS